MPLTSIVVASAKPSIEGKQIKLFDSNGLFLLITPNGRKYWRLKYRWAGKEKLLALGVYPDVSLKEARIKRDEARGLLARDTDPSAKRRRDRIAAKEAALSSFRSFALQWHQKMASDTWSPNHAKSVLRSLEIHLFPDLGDHPIADIRPLTLLTVLRKVEETGKLDTLKRLRQYASEIFKIAISQEKADYNPAADLNRNLRRPPRPRPMAALEQAQLPKFLSHLQNTDLTPHTRVLFTVVMVCFTRIGETVRTRWDDLDLNQGVWTIPPQNRKLRHKNKATSPPHIVPLPRQVIEALASLIEFRGAGPFVFQNHHHPLKHMNESTPRKVLERMGYGGKDKRHGHVVTHGFRSMASTILNEAGFNPDAVERQLSHTDPNQVRAAYNRALYLDERRRMLQCWADYIEAVSRGEAAFPLDARESTTIAQSGDPITTSQAESRP